ncbi:hypothetical protein B0H15DRAFT_927151 [Mycena belliarum]|uniref:DUF6533 domain-containing protein n=1 Tax=Mycena belliarum TaxID=1033014 RepID=A0AAD6UG52_9AGAR|nr:hypothetical protein B0H15DRAFT_927151 [Mycena belliae]
MYAVELFGHASANQCAARNSKYYLSAVSFSASLCRRDLRVLTSFHGEPGLLFYDYFLTLGWEASCYWGARFTWPTLLFFVNRYGTLLGNIPIVLEIFWTEFNPRVMQICRHIYSYHQYLLMVVQVVVAAMFILRTHALYARNNRVLGLMIVVTAVVLGVALWAIITTGKPTDHTISVPLHIGCPAYAATRPETKGLIIAWAAVAAFDSMIFLLTLYKVLYRRRLSGLPLLAVLVRDGAVYFGVMVVANVANILTYESGGDYNRGVATTFGNVISSIMASRLMLNLRDPALALPSRDSGSGRRETGTEEHLFSTNLAL